MPVPNRNIQQRSILTIVKDWFLKNDFGLGPTVDATKAPPHVHTWEYFNTIRCGWRIESGRPIGERIGITLAILDVEKHPRKNETKVSQLHDWQRSGYEFVHTSQTIYKCKVQGCCVTKSIDVYVAPVKGDGTGPFVADVGSRSSFQKRFTETTRMPIAVGNNVIVRREVPVERMKRHGVKQKKAPPVVPMES